MRAVLPEQTTPDHTRPADHTRVAALTAFEEPLGVDHGLQAGHVIEGGGDGASGSLHGGYHTLRGPLHLQIHGAGEIVHTLSRTDGGGG